MNYNKEGPIEVRILPLIKEVEKQCYIDRVPFFVCIPKKDTDDGGTEYYYAMNTGIIDEVSMNRNIIPQLALVANGMKTILAPAKEDDLSMATVRSISADEKPAPPEEE